MSTKFKKSFSPSSGNFSITSRHQSYFIDPLTSTPFEPLFIDFLLFDSLSDCRIWFFLCRSVGILNFLELSSFSSFSVSLNFIDPDPRCILPLFWAICWCPWTCFIKNPRNSSLHLSLSLLRTSLFSSYFVPRTLPRGGRSRPKRESLTEKVKR